MGDASCAHLDASDCVVPLAESSDMQKEVALDVELLMAMQAPPRVPWALITRVWVA